MPRPIWKGHLSFGLVMMPVTLYPAETPLSDIKFFQVDKRDLSRIKYRRVNERTGKEVPWGDIIKAHELEDGRVVTMTNEDYKNAAPHTAKTVEIGEFVSRDSISPKYFEKPYYLEPGKGGEKVYVLLREALKKSGRVGLGKVVITTRQYLAAVMPEGDALVLNTMRFADELREPADLTLPSGAAAKSHVSPKEVEMAQKLIEGMTGEFDPADFKDEYRESLEKWIEKKARAGGKAPKVEEEEKEEEIPESYNIMDLLKKSVEAKGKGAKKAKRAAPARTAHRKTA